MNARILATAAAFAVIAAAAPAIASPCTDACAKAYQQCNNASATDQTCLPKWGQCKKACSPPSAKTGTSTTTGKTSTKPGSKH